MEPLQVIAAPRPAAHPRAGVGSGAVRGRDRGRSSRCPGRRSASTCAYSRRPGFVVERREGTSRLYQRRQGRSGLPPRRGRGSLAARPGPGQGPGRGRASGYGQVMTGDGVVEVSLHVAAPPEMVFSLLHRRQPLYPVDGHQRGTWSRYPAAATASRCVTASKRPGSSSRLSPPHRLVFTWGWTHDRAVPPGTSRVVVTLRAEHGGTRVVLRHYGLPDDDQGEHHRKDGSRLSRPARSPGSRAAIPARTRTPDNALAHTRYARAHPDNASGHLTTGSST